MDKTKFTVRVEADALESARRYADQHGTTLTRLVNEFLRSLGKTLQSQSGTPVLDKLSGSLQPGTSLEDYFGYLERKYMANDSPITHPG